MIPVELKELCIYDDKKIKAEIVISNKNSPSDDLDSENEGLKTQLENLKYKDTGERIGYATYTTGIFEKKEYPIKERIQIYGTDTSQISFNDPNKELVENRIVTSPYCVQSVDSPFNCLISENSILCNAQPKPKKAFNIRVIEDEFSDSFDGLIIMSEKVILDEYDEIEMYGLNMAYYPSGDEDRPYEFLEENRSREEQIINTVKKTRQFLKNIFNKRDFDLVKEELQKEFNL